MKKLFTFLSAILLATALAACSAGTTQTTNSQSNMNATIKTNFGDIQIELYADKTPETVKNFTTLAQEGKYDGVIFHRVIPDFMVQTGDFENGDGTGGHSYKGAGTSIPDEFDSSLSHEYGTLSMANRGPNTGGSQFFIVQNQQGTAWLDGKHSIFGKVTSGMDVVEQIAALETDTMARPTQDAIIETITIAE